MSSDNQMHHSVRVQLHYEYTLNPGGTCVAGKTLAVLLSCCPALAAGPPDALPGLLALPPCCLGLGPCRCPQVRATCSSSSSCPAVHCWPALLPPCCPGFAALPCSPALPACSAPLPCWPALLPCFAPLPCCCPAGLLSSAAEACAAVCTLVQWTARMHLNKLCHIACNHIHA